MAVLKKTIEHGGYGGDIAEQLTRFSTAGRSQQRAGTPVKPHHDSQQVFGRGD
jgi:hypothetical protein